MLGLGFASSFLPRPQIGLGIYTFFFCEQATSAPFECIFKDSLLSHIVLDLVTSYWAKLLVLTWIARLTDNLMVNLTHGVLIKSNMKNRCTASFLGLPCLDFEDSASASVLPCLGLSLHCLGLTSVSAVLPQSLPRKNVSTTSLLNSFVDVLLTCNVMCWQRGHIIHCRHFADRVHLRSTWRLRCKFTATEDVDRLKVS